MEITNNIKLEEEILNIKNKIKKKLTSGAKEF